MVDEIWIPVKGFEDFYEVSNLGGLRSLACWRVTSYGVRRNFRPKIMKLNSKQYGSVLSLRGRTVEIRRVVQFHKLVAEHFVPNPNNLPFVCHKDDDTSNNRWDNLVWGDHQLNMDHAKQNNRLRPARGAKAGRAKLTEEMVRAIRAFPYKPFDRSASYNFIGRQYGIGGCQVRSIIQGMGWRSLQ